MQTGPIEPDDPRVLAAAALVKHEFDAEAAAGFRTLRHIPSSGVIRLLDHLDTLDKAALSALLDAQTRVAALCFFPGPLITGAYEKLRVEPALALRQEAMQSLPFSMGLRYGDLRMSRMMLNDAESMRHMAATRTTLRFVPRDDPPPELLDGVAISDCHPAKAPQLRKLLNPMLGDLLSAKPEKKLGGELVYRGALDGVPLAVSIIFSNRFGQMHYAVSWAMRERGFFAQRLSYEALFGTNTGWDYLTEENAARSIELLGQLIRSLAGLFSRVAALP